MPHDSVLSEQLEYYRARAGEYDRWWRREGRYDRDTESNRRWFAEVAALQRALDEVDATGDVIELACGTGIWTERLAPRARTLTAVDAAPEVLALNRDRLGDRAETVRYVEADLFAWGPPPHSADLCVFAFWLSHVPEDRFGAFWDRVRRALRRPGGRVFFIDSDRSERSTAADHVLPRDEEATMIRRLDDGRAFRIVKRFYEPAHLECELAQLGWQAEVRRTGEFFIHGTARPAA